LERAKIEKIIEEGRGKGLWYLIGNKDLFLSRKWKGKFPMIAGLRASRGGFFPGKSPKYQNRKKGGSLGPEGTSLSLREGAGTHLTWFDPPRRKRKKKGTVEMEKRDPTPHSVN